MSMSFLSIAKNTSNTTQLAVTNPQQRNYVLFDLSLYGHHPVYIRHLITYWQQKEFLERLTIVVLPDFFTVHADVVALADSSCIRFISITASETDALKNRSSGINRSLRNFQEWHFFQRYARTLKADHCLMLYFDSCLLPLAAGMSFPCPFSGIYFRPTFHYSTFYPQSGAAQPLNARLQKWREQLSIKRALDHPKFKTLFSLDPLAVEGLRQLYPKADVIELPDPVSLRHSAQSEVAALRQSLEIECDRKVLLLFGAITERKGIFQLLEAISLLPSDVCQHLCILLIGESNPTMQPKLRSRIEILQQARPVQFVINFEYLDEALVPAYFHLADIILAPYQQHVGMSGILLQAAAARKPVLGSDYGLMGEITRRHQLGVAVDTTRPQEIADGIYRLIAKDGNNLYNPCSAYQFARANSAERFAQVICKKMLNYA